MASMISFEGPFGPGLFFDFLENNISQRLSDKSKKSHYKRGAESDSIASSSVIAVAECPSPSR